MSKYLILSANNFDFENNKGERVKGTKIAYINKKPSKKEGVKGYPPLIVNISDKDIIDKLVEVPGVYEIDFEQVTGKNNKPELMITDLEFISMLEMGLLFQA